MWVWVWFADVCRFECNCCMEMGVDLCVLYLELQNAVKPLRDHYHPGYLLFVSCLVLFALVASYMLLCYPHSHIFLCSYS